MTYIKKGDWINRHYDDRRYATTKVHLVVRVIEHDTAVVRCGIHLPQHTNAKVPNKLMRVILPYPEEKCQACREGEDRDNTA